MIRLLTPADLWDDIRRDLLSAPDLERAGVGFAGHLRSNGTTDLLLRDWWSVNPDEYLVQLGSHLEVSPRFWARAAKRARRSGESLVITHSHPRTSGSPQFSASDLGGERRLVPSLQARADVHVATVVVGPDGSTAACYPPNRDRAPLRLQEAGTFWPVPDVDVADPRFARQALAVGHDGNRVLSELTVGVVGLGGLGSHVVSQLAHLGVGTIVGVDFDRVEPSNLSRLIGATRWDATLRRRKTAVARRAVRRLGTSTFNAVDGRIDTPDNARKLLSCDLVVGCTDTQTSRAVLNTLAWQYYLPVVDLGVQLRADGSSGGRVTWLLPHAPCQWCRGILDPDVVRAEQLPDHIRRAEFDAGYIADLDVEQPAVVSVNGTIASIAVTEILARLTGFLGDDRGDMLVLKLQDGTIRRVGGRRRPGCPTCSSAGNLGAGDLIGLDTL